MIECVKYVTYESGYLQGFAILYISELDAEVAGCALFKKNEKRWVNMPSRQYKNDDGEKKSYSLIWFRDEKRKEKFDKEAIKAIDKWCEENPSNKEEKSFSERY